SRGARSLTRFPPITMSPEVMSSRPTIIRSSVDFPQPDGPTRIMNSPSSTSIDTSFTAGNPSPYFLTMFFISMAAIGSTLHCAGRQAGDDSALEQEDDDDHRDRDDHGRRGKERVRRVELVRSHEEGHLRGYRPRSRGRRQGDRQGVLVPREEEREDRRREHARCR